MPNETVIEKADKSWKTNDSIINELFESFEDKQFGKCYYSKPKHALVGEFEKQLLPNQYDTIEIKGYFIVATKNNKTTIYNPLMNRIADNVRSYSFSSSRSKDLTILQEDSIFSIDKKGNKSFQNIDESYDFNYGYNRNKNIKNINDKWYIQVKTHRNGRYDYVPYTQSHLIEFPNGLHPTRIELAPDSYEFGCNIFIWDGDKMGLFYFEAPRGIDISTDDLKSNYKKNPDTVYLGKPILAKMKIPKTMSFIHPVNNYGNYIRVEYKKCVEV